MNDECERRAGAEQTRAEAGRVAGALSCATSWRPPRPKCQEYALPDESRVMGQGRAISETRLDRDRQPTVPAGLPAHVSEPSGRPHVGGRPVAVTQCFALLACRSTGSGDSGRVGSEEGGHVHLPPSPVRCGKVRNFVASRNLLM